MSTLKDGYWDRTEVIELPDGSRRVRKRTKGTVTAGPWGLVSLRREIQYLRSLPDEAAGVFPPVLAAWDRPAPDRGDEPDVGYEMPYYAHHRDAGALARCAALDQAEADRFQDHLAEAVLDRLHTPMQPDEPLSEHLCQAVRQGLARLEDDAALRPVIEADTLELNGCQVAGPRAVFERIVADGSALRAIDAGPNVRIHGDLFLENILWCPAGDACGQPRLILVDPVSVAGVWCGTPLFDLAKYESYATGELLALRSEWLDVSGFDEPGSRRYGYRIRWEAAALRPFRDIDWRRRFRRAFVAKYGAVDQRLYHLLDGYFSIAMAANTSGAQRRARLLKATAEFNAVMQMGGH